MKRLNKDLVKNAKTYPEKIVQFGEGNFLRGFIDWMVQQMNHQGLFEGSVVAIQPTPHGKVVPKLEAQDHLYTVVLRGIENHVQVDQDEVITSISRSINPYTDWEKVLELAYDPQLHYVFSNTTEAGLTYQKENYEKEKAPLSYPGKLTAFLHERYVAFNGAEDKGLYLFPCELVEENGELLKELVLKVSHDFGFSDEFRDWIESSHTFFNTLVDRIVTGYPKNSIEAFQEKLGYEDQLLTVGEPFHLFVIEGPETMEAHLPFKKAGLNVKWDQVKPYRELKVRILNGLHTMMYALGVQNGKETVLEAMEDSKIRPLIDQCLNKEILPMIQMGEKTKQQFADSVIQRFLNPFNRHLLTGLGMSGLNKYKARCLPTLLDFYEKKGELPEVLTLALAAGLLFFRVDHYDQEGNPYGKAQGQSYEIREDKDLLNFLEEAWSLYDGSKEGMVEFVNRVLAYKEFWGVDLTQVHQLTLRVAENLMSLIEKGAEETMGQMLETRFAE